VYPTHFLGEPARVGQESTPAALGRVAAVFDGGRLFYARYARPGSEFGEWESTGVSMFSLTEIARQTREFRAKYDGSDWLRTLVVIGGGFDGTALFVADPNGDPSGDWPVLLFDDEYELAEPSRIAESVFGFVLDVLANPLAYVTEWRHFDEQGEEYFVASVDFVDEQ
jgi:hypothetical protein